VGSINGTVVHEKINNLGLKRLHVVNNLIVTSASRELAPYCRALLKDTMVFSGAS